MTGGIKPDDWGHTPVWYHMDPEEERKARNCRRYSAAESSMESEDDGRGYQNDPMTCFVRGECGPLVVTILTGEKPRAL